MKTTYELMKEARKRKAERLQKIDGVYTLTKRTERKKKLIIFQDDGSQREEELSHG
jgi:hypothetical protein